MDKQVKTCFVLFQPSGKRGRVACGTTIMEAARAVGVGIEGLCAENAVCGKCKVRIERKSPSSQNENALVSSITQTERKLITTLEQAEGIRLACQAQIEGDIIVQVPEGSCQSGQVHKEAREDRKSVV